MFGDREGATCPSIGHSHKHCLRWSVSSLHIWTQSFLSYNADTGPLQTSQCRTLNTPTWLPIDWSPWQVVSVHWSVFIMMMKLWGIMKTELSRRRQVDQLELAVERPDESGNNNYLWTQQQTHSSPGQAEIAWEDLVSIHDISQSLGHTLMVNCDDYTGVAGPSPGRRETDLIMQNMRIIIQSWSYFCSGLFPPSMRSGQSPGIQLICSMTGSSVVGKRVRWSSLIRWERAWVVGGVVSSDIWPPLTPALISQPTPRVPGPNILLCRSRYFWVAICRE